MDAHSFIARKGLVSSGSIEAQTSVTASTGYKGFLYDTSSYTLTASYASQSIGFPTSVNGYFPYYSSNTLSTSSLFHTDGVTLTADALIVGTASLAKTASFYGGSVTSASYAVTASNTTGTVNGTQYSFASGYVTTYSTSITCSNADDGHFINLTGGTLVYLTGSLSSTFSTILYQSGSGTVTITGSDSTVVIRQRQSFKSLAGQYAVASIVRVPNGDFVLSGDCA